MRFQTNRRRTERGATARYPEAAHLTVARQSRACGPGREAPTHIAPVLAIRRQLNTALGSHKCPLRQDDARVSNMCGARSAAQPCRNRMRLLRQVSSSRSRGTAGRSAPDTTVGIIAVLPEPAMAAASATIAAPLRASVSGFFSWSRPLHDERRGRAVARELPSAG
jgi:hypothetical protein